MLDVRHLRQIIAIHRMGSFAKAAEVLGIAQPSLSGSVARLEDELGVKIFDRTAAGSQLTPIGEMLLARAPKVIAEADHLLRDAALVANGEGGEIHLGVGVVLRDCFMPRLLVRIAEHHPRLRLSTTVAPAGALVTRVASRQLDVAICAEGRQPADMPFTPIFACDFIAAVSPSHPLAGQRGVTRDQLLQYSCGGALSAYRNSVLLGVAEDHEQATAYRSDDFSTLISLARAGLCVLIAPACAIGDGLQSGALVAVDFDLGVNVVFGAVATQAVSLSPTIRRIIGHAVELGAEMQAVMPAGGIPAQTSSQPIAGRPGAN